MFLSRLLDAYKVPTNLIRFNFISSQYCSPKPNFWKRTRNHDRIHSQANCSFVPRLCAFSVFTQPCPRHYIKVPLTVGCSLLRCGRCFPDVDFIDAYTDSPCRVLTVEFLPWLPGLMPLNPPSIASKSSE